MGWIKPHGMRPPGIAGTENRNRLEARPRRRSASTRPPLEGEVVLRREVALHQRSQMTSSMIAPSVTCRPWKPVSMKNVEP